MLCLRRAAVLLALPAIATLLYGAEAPSTMHLRLTGSVPAKDSAVSTIPTELRLTYSLRPEVAFSGITLRGADSTAIKLGPLQLASDGVTIVAPILQPLGVGQYRVEWRAASTDGHPVRGTFSFTIFAPASATGGPAPEPAIGGASPPNTSRDHTTR